MEQSFDDTVPVLDVHPDQARAHAKQWAAQYQHLKARVQAVTAEIGQNPASEVLRGRELVADQTGSAAALQHLTRGLRAQVTKARDAVKAVTHMVSQVVPGPQQPQQAAALADAIDAADQMLSGVRTQQCEALEALYAEEAQLEVEMCAIVERLDAEIAEEAEASRAEGARPGPGSGRERAQSAGPRGRAVSRGRTTSRPASAGRGRSRSVVGRASCPGDAGGGTLAPEVQEYNDFMELHGPTGGWDLEDHEEFLAILRSCEGDYTHAVAIVMERAIGFSRQEVIAHARWHMDLCDLELRKRVALERWRQRRVEQRAALRTAEAALGSDTADQAQREWQRDQRSKEQERVLIEAKKAMAAQWRAEQEARKREVAEQARRQEEARREAERAERERRQAAIKARVQEAKRKKEQQQRDAQRRAAAEAAMRAALSVPTPQQLQRLAERNAATFSRRLSLVATKEAAKHERERVQQSLLEKVHVEAPSDPRRLLRGTVAHMQRVEAQRAEERRSSDGGFILHVSRRTTPQWRAGLPGL